MGRFDSQPLLEVGDPEAVRTLQLLLRIAAPATYREGGEDAEALMFDEAADALEELVDGEEISRELACRIGWTVVLGAIGFGHAAASYCRAAGSRDYAGGLAAFERLVEPLLTGAAESEGSS